MQTVRYSEACENLNTLIDKVVVDKAPLTITCEDGATVVLISESEWVSIEERLHLL